MDRHHLDRRDYEMPPKKLPEKVIADFKKWIEMGAPDPRITRGYVKTEIDIKKGKSFGRSKASQK